MDLYLKVRLARRGGMSERKAADHFGISRVSVKKIMGFSVPPGYRRTAQIKRPKLDGFTGFVDQWLLEDAVQAGSSFFDAVKILKEPKTRVVVAVNPDDGAPIGVVLRAHRRY